MAAEQRTSRAVVRNIEPGTTALCASCEEPVRFKAKVKHQQVICNVYEDGRWLRVEHFHRDCYETAGTPYGEADASQLIRPKARPAA